MNLDIIVPILSSTAFVALLKIAEWRWSVYVNKQEWETHSDAHEDPYIVDLRARLAKLEERADENDREIKLWKKKYSELQEKYLEERSKVELLERKVRDLERQLNGGAHE